MQISHLAHKFGQATLISEVKRNISQVNHLRSFTSKMTFLELEELGTVPPARCPLHTNCKGCSYRAMEISRKDNAELELIEKNMWLEDNHIEVRYPCTKDLSLLSDNRQQVISMAINLEKRLKRKNQINVYNAEIQGFIDRGVARQISQEEMDAWTGPINYISHH